MAWGIFSFIHAILSVSRNCHVNCFLSLIFPGKNAKDVASFEQPGTLPDTSRTATKIISPVIGHPDLETELCDVRNQNLGNAVRKRLVCTPTATVQGPGQVRYRDGVPCKGIR